ncbi:MAG: polysaccharide biosynthesis tyrosine autokinase [Bacteroidetes bacterium]|nr:polysaccharide biosynthesis tyrosine autokinase [Bacteroidota bacterium]
MSNHKASAFETFNIKEFILTALSYKYLYIVSFSICLTAAFMINNFSPTVYEVNSIIEPVENNRSTLMGSNDLFSGLGALAEARNLQNDITSLNSFTLIYTTLNKLNLEVGYFTKTRKIFKQRYQNYLDSPFTVNIDKSHIQPINAKFYIVILDDLCFRLTSSEDKVTLYNYIDNVIVSEHNVLEIDTICKFNEIISNKNFKFSVSLNKDLYVANPKNEPVLYFEFYHLDALTLQYLNKLEVEPVNIRSSLIKASFRGDNIDLTIDFLNKYLQTYLEDNLSKKNKIAINTINFIDSQLSDVSDSLLISETKLKDYRSSHQVMDISFQGQQALEQMTEIETERSTLQIQERYYNYILDYFSKNQDVSGLAPPSAANVVDPILNTLILDLLALNAQKSNILSNNTEKNLFLGQIENQIKLQQKAIIENVTNNLNTLDLTINELNYRSEKISREISKLPRTELNMVSMQRKFNLSDAIYTFLLQKRSEAAITMASNYPDYEILEPARKILKTILSPKIILNWLLALFIAFMGPTIIIILIIYFNEKVTSTSDVQHITDRPVLGIIYSNLQKTDNVVPESPNSPIAESFRNLRSALFLRLKSEPLKVILVTSPQPQDGKSFISFNLAASIASVGHKTIILDCDFRRPTLHKKFKESDKPGLSNYMANHTTIDKIIKNTFDENLSFIPAGPLLPNSSELLESGILDDLIKTLKSKYEYIILDTTPAGIVADATLMMKYATKILLVCRNNHTRKDVFTEVINNLNTNKFTNYDIVFNDQNLKRSQYSHYNKYYRKKQNI